MADSARSSQPTVLEVPITIQATQHVEGKEQRELFTESTKTTLVFDNGAVLNLKSKVVPGQCLFLRNDRSGKEILCKVIEWRQVGDSGYTDVEFTVRDPSFWEVPAAPLDSAAPDPAPQSGIPAAQETPAAAAQPESLAPIGEEAPAPAPQSDAAVRAAAAFEITHPLSLPDDGADWDEEKDAKLLALLMATDAKPKIKREFAAKAKKETGRPSASEPAQSSEMSTEPAGNASASFLPGSLAFRIRTLIDGENRKVVGIAAGVVLVLALGLVWHALGSSPACESGRPLAAAQPSSAPASSPNAGASATVAGTSAGVQPGASTSNSTAAPAAVVAQNSDATLVNAAERGSHAVAVAAPRLEASNRARPSDREPLERAAHRRPKGIAPIIPAKIIAQPEPAIPSWAKELDTDGVVKLDALIDENGNLAETTPLSGPRVLQHEAERAVELWIFAPALLDGKPAATHMILTVQFQR
ncbi:MAG: energy transducer TonB [Candidatus Acidiferrales bacterium]